MTDTEKTLNWNMLCPMKFRWKTWLPYKL